jgi:hypothetical protein
METLLRDSLLDLGHEVVEQAWDPVTADDERGDAEFAILPHASRRDRPDADLFVKEMHLPGLFTVDANGWGVEHSAIRRGIDFGSLDASRAMERVRALCAHLTAANVSRLPQPPPGSVPDPGYILLPLQVPNDSVVVDHSQVSVIALLDAVSGWAERQRQRVAVKMHPSSFDHRDLVDAVARRTAGSSYVFEVRGNIHSLIAASRGVFVINSSTGFEALVHGKPVATFGDCDYAPATFAATPEAIGDAAAWCYAYGPGQQARAAQFVDWYRSHHAYPTGEDDIAATRQRLRTYLDAVVPR